MAKKIGVKPKSTSTKRGVAKTTKPSKVEMAKTAVIKSGTGRKLTATPKKVSMTKTPLEKTTAKSVAKSIAKKKKPL